MTVADLNLYTEGYPRYIHASQIPFLHLANLKLVREHCLISLLKFLLPNRFPITARMLKILKCIAYLLIYNM